MVLVIYGCCVEGGDVATWKVWLWLDYKELSGE